MNPTAEPLTWQRPREHRVPEHVRTWGPETVELALIAGIACLPWQEMVLTDMLTERADGTWAAREAGVTVGRQNGKSVLALVRVLAGLYVLEEELIVYTAHQLRTAEEIFGRLTDKVERIPELRKRYVKTIRRADKLGIELHSPKQRLTVAARSKESIRGFSADVIILDEAQMGLNEDDMAALGPTQRTRPNPQTIVMGTPPLGPGTWWGRFRRRALAGDPDISWHGWTPRPRREDETLEQWRTDREVWAQTHPAFGVLVNERAITHDKKTLGDKFDQECLCLFPDEPEDRGWEVFTEGQWLAACDPESLIEGPFALAVESSHDLQWLSIGAAGRTAEGLRHLELVDRFPSDTGKLVGWLKKRLADPAKRPSVVAIDPAGPAGYLIPEVEKHCQLEVFKPLGRDVAAACGSVYVGISGREGAARDVRVCTSPPPWVEPRDRDEKKAVELAEALYAAARKAVWRDRGDAKVFDRRVEDATDDVGPLLAVTLADLAIQRQPKARARPRAVRV
jgi:Phage Terminase